MKKLLILFNILITMSLYGYRITGTVYNEYGQVLSGVEIFEDNTHKKVYTNQKGEYEIEVKDSAARLHFKLNGYEKESIEVKNKKIIDVILRSNVSKDKIEIMENVVFAPVAPKKGGYRTNSRVMPASLSRQPYIRHHHLIHYPEPANNESYKSIEENNFKSVTQSPLSTFSADVDVASYSNIRRFLKQGILPPKDAVRIEEMINYFSYNYDVPKGNTPLHIQTEVTVAPWNSKHQLVHIGVKGKEIVKGEKQRSNLVFLIDVSGSMNAFNKLPLLKSSFKLLVNQLEDEDKVSIVVYAGAAGVVLPPTDASEKKKIMQSLDNLQAGGSTAGAAGLTKAYALAKENFIKNGNNRVILATDGDFNVGISTDNEMERFIESKREEGIFLSVLGFGMGNYKDSKMETLADRGNGNYAYIDNLLEAKKVLVNEVGSTLYTIAKDVKIQVEFNPRIVAAYRLVGYENRLLNNEDFNNDQKDAGEIGAGHTMTALYEIIPQGTKSEFLPLVDSLKYQTNDREVDKNLSNEMATVKIRYKEPSGSKSKLIAYTVKNQVQKESTDHEWATAVAGFGMILRESKYLNDFQWEGVLKLARESIGKDENGYRSEFINLVLLAKEIDNINNQ